MCGIAGYLSFENIPADRSLLGEMNNNIYHRGPDENGIFIDGPLGFGHTRLSIIDLSGGKQPMTTVDGRYTITFNGEIFNYIELREELIKKGHRFKTSSDTEVILHSYEEFADQCVSKFNGQWAFAIWDSKKRHLFLSRDRLGIRPLYFSRVGGRFSFSSEIKSLFVLPWLPREIDPISLRDSFVFWHPIPPRTIFKEVECLPPGHNIYVDYQQKRVDTRAFWQVDYSKGLSEERSEDDLADELRSLLTDATRIRLRADVPVGGYLSGGLDSSVTSGLVNSSDARLHTFSVTFEEKQFDESSYQQEVAQFLGTEHKAVHCRYEDICNSFRDVVWHGEQPLMRTAPAPLFLLSKFVRSEGYKVVLTGEGADEVFGGYDIFKEAKIRRFCAKLSDSKIRPLLLKRLYPYMPMIQNQSVDYLKAFFDVNPSEISDPLYSHRPRWKNGLQNNIFFSPDVKNLVAEDDPFADFISRLPQKFENWDDFSKSQYLETIGLLPGYILSVQGDRMLMGNSIEGRFPFLDYRVVEFGARLPSNVKMKVLNEKFLLKKAMKDVVPLNIIERKNNHTELPIHKAFVKWIREWIMVGWTISFQKRKF